MADAEIRLTADAQQAKAELQSLGTEADKAEKEVRELGQAGNQAGDQLERGLSKGELAARSMSGSAQQAGGELKRIGKDAAEAGEGFSGLAGKATQAVGVIGLVITTFEAARRGTRAVIDAMKDWGLDIDDLVQKLISKLGPAQEDSQKSSEELANAQKILRERYGETADTIEEAREKLERLSREQYNQASAAEKQRDRIFGNVKALKEQTQAVVDAIRAQVEHGQVTEEETEAARGAIQRLLDAYLRAGEAIPDALASIAAELGVVSSAQERAANAAEKEAAALELQAEKAAGATRETKPLVEAKKEHSEISENLAKFLELENDQLEEQARLAKEAADAELEQIEAAKKRRDELEKKQSDQGSLEPKELAELFDLQGDAAKKQFEYGEAAQESDAAQLALNESQQEAIDLQEQLGEVMQTTTEITQEQAEALGDIGNVDLGGVFREWEQESGTWVEQTKYDAERAGKNFEDGFVGPVRDSIPLITDGTGTVADGFDDVTDAADGAANAVGDIADEAGKIGDETAKGADKATTAVDKMMEGLDGVIEKQERVKQLWHEIEQAARQAAEQV